MEFSFSKLIGEVKLILLNPKGFWVEQKEADDDQKLWLTYLLPIALTGAVAVFIGELFKPTDFFIQFPLLKATREVLLFVLQYFISVFFTNELMKTYGAEKNIELARKLVVYSMTPMLLVSLITGLFPFLYVVDILGIYGFYLFAIGAKELLNFPENKEQSYILITIVVNFFIFSFLSILLSKLLLSF